MIEETIAHLSRAFVRFLAEAVFVTICGHIGNYAVRLLSFGRIDLHPERGGESVIASFIGLVLLIGTAASIVLGVLPHFTQR
jgi:hypothetical protein